MYTGSLESEIGLFADLCKSRDMSMADNETKYVRKCPKCNNGSVITRKIHGYSNGRESYGFDHYCDTCGEIFYTNRLHSDIFLHKPFDVCDKIVTPFGDIKVKINGKQADFRYRTDIYETKSKAAEKVISIEIIDIDVSRLHINDIITCGFDTELLEYNDSDERSVIFSRETASLLLGLCAFEPYEWETDTFCYQLEDYPGKAFKYRIVSSPDNFDENELYESKFISLAVVCINKKDYKDPNTELFLALTMVI